MAVLYGQARRYINGDSVNAGSDFYNCKFGLLNIKKEVKNND